MIARKLFLLAAALVATAAAQTITSTSPLPSGQVNTAYSYFFTASPPGEYYWSNSTATGQTGLPSSLSLNPYNGQLSGTPTTAGTYTFRVTLNGQISKDFSLTIVGPVTLTSTSPLPSARIGSSYSYQFTASGGTPANYEFTITGLPAGLSTNGTSGLITGTPTGPPGTTTISASVDDGTSTSSGRYSLTVQPSQLTFTPPTTIPNGTPGAAYSFNFGQYASGGVTPYTYSIVSGSPAPGLTLNTSTGVLSGTISTNASTGPYSFVVGVASGSPSTPSYQTAQSSETMNVRPVLQLTTTSLPNAVQGSSYSTALAATGGDAPYAFSLTSGTLPSGLTLSSGGVLSGTPTQSGTFPITVQVTDSGSPNPQTASRSFRLNVIPALAFTTASTLPNATPNVPYSTTLATTGGVAPVTIGPSTCEATGLPSGLSLVNGTVSGTTNAAPGSYTFCALAADSGNPQQTVTKLFQINVATALTITSPSPLPTALQNAAYSYTFTSNAGTQGYWTVSTQSGQTGLPQGLTLDPYQGILSGQPTTTGTYTFRITESANSQTAYKDFALTVAPPVTLTSTSPLPNARLGSSYSYQFQTTGGNGSVRFAAGSGVPAGLTLDPVTGILSGTPTGSPTVASFRVTASDSTTNPTTSDTKTYQLSVVSSLTITTSSPLPNAAQNQPYSTTFTSSGGNGTVSYTVTGGSLPAGLTLATNGTLSGTPTVSGPFNFTVTATDQTSPTPQTTSSTFALTVASALTITTASPLPNATQGAAYSVTLATSGGTTPVSFALASGSSLPAGLTLSNGTISGTPTGSGTFSFTISATDSGNPQQTVTKTFQLTVQPGLSITTNSPLPDAAQGSPYSTTIAASGGVGTTTFSVTGGSLPAGLTLAANGALTGTPTASGPYSFTVRATDQSSPTPQTASRTFALNVVSGLTITTASPLPNATQGSAYSVTVATSGGTAPVTLTLASGSSLPAGLTFSNGTISGTPTGSGTFSFTVTATDSSSPQQTVNKTFQLTVQPSLSITTNSPLPDAAQGSPYSTTIAASGGAGTTTFSVTGGSLPAGLTLAANGALTGTPTASGPYSFTVRATDQSTPTVQTASRTFALNVVAGLTITTASPLPNATQGSAYSTTVATSGGTAPVTLTLANGSSLPAGLTFSNGSISGTPTSAGTFSFTLAASDSGSPQQNVTKTFQLTVQAGLSISTASPLPDAAQGSPYSTTIAASGGVGTPTFSVTGGSLPAGLTLNANGTLTGTPSVSGPYSFTVRATDQSSPTPQTASRTFALNVVPGLAITTATPLPNATQGSGYSVTIATSGGTAPVTLALASGSSLPAGLTFSNGTISGAPTNAGTFSFTVSATDSGSPQQSATKTFQLTIQPGLSISTNSPLPDAVQGQTYSTTIATSGGVGTATFSLTGGSLPAGLTLAPNGTLTGSPTAGGSFSFTVKATDQSTPTAQTATRTFALTVATGLTFSTPSPLPGAVTNVPYTTTITTAGGTAPVSIALASGSSLPPGLTLNNGTLSGTPTTPGNYQFTLRAGDAGNPAQSATRTYALTVASTLIISTASPLPNGVQNSPYTFALASSGGTTPVTFALASGSALPPGLGLNNGTITGTPTTPGSFPFTIVATDAGSPQQSISKAFQLTIQPLLSITTLSPLPDAVQNAAYSATIATSGGVGTTTLSVTGGALPAGLTLAANGAITGTPTASGPFSFTVTATDQSTPTAQTVSRTYSLSVASPLSITTTSPLTNAVQGTPYSLAFATSGGTGTVSLSLATGSTLPPGLSLSNGTLSGTPAASGSFSFVLSATDTGNPAQTVTKAFRLTVQPSLGDVSGALPNGAVGLPYSQQVSITGGVAPLRFALASGSSLPAGLSLSPTGLVSGTPTAAGLFNLVLQVTDSSVPTPQVVTRTLQLTIQPQLVFVTTTLPTGVVGAQYAVTPLVTGGVAPYTATVTSGALPPGVSFDGATGSLTGKPTAAGTYNFGLQVTDTGSPVQTLTGTFSLVVNPALSITTAPALPPAVRTVAYSTSIAAAGGLPPYSFQVTAGALPPGLSLNASNGQLTGTATQLGLYTFTITATDAYPGTANTTSRQFTLGVYDPIQLQPTSLPSGTVGIAYFAAISATGGTAPYQFTITQGSLPPGLTFANGRITGTPLPGTTTSTTTYTFHVHVVDSTNNPTNLAGDADYSITIMPSGLTFSVGPILPNATAARPYTIQLATSGGTLPVTYALTGGALPVGLTLSPAGLISGQTPTAGTYTFTVTARDSAAPATAVQTVSQTFTLTVLPARLDLQITNAGALPDGTVGTAYLAGITVTGGAPPYTFRVNSGSLPDGLVLNSDGSLSGTPTKAGTFTFGVLVGDSSNVTYTGAFFTIKINPAALTVTLSLGDGQVGLAYSGSVTVSGGVPPYRIAISGLPPGVTANGQTISGTPTQAGKYTVTVVVTDLQNTQVTKTANITINAVLRLITNSIPDAVVGQPYTANFAASGGVPPYFFTLTGTLPDGLTFDRTRGVISGTPTTPGTISVTVQVADQSGQTDSRTFTAVIGASLTLTTNGPLPAGTVNVAYVGSLAASGGTPPYTFSGGGAGLTVNANGSISGTPTQAGTFTINASVTDQAGQTVSKSLAITINPAPPATLTLSGSVDASGTVGSPVSGLFTAAGGTEPYTYSLASGSLPPGVTLSGNTLSGSPTAPGTYNFTVQVTDSANQTATASFTITIALPAVPTVTITGTPVAIQPQQQSAVGVSIAAPFPVDLTGILTLTFTPDVVNGNGFTDPAIQFSTGGQSVAFTIPAGQTNAVFSVPNLQIQTGSTAGTITLRVTLQAQGTTLTLPSVPDRSIQIPRTAPVITSVKLTRTATGFTVDITGYSTPREVLTGTFTFQAAAGTPLQTSSLTVPLTDTVTAYYQSAASQPYGTQFTISMPFNVTQGAASALTAVSVTLTNSVGASNSVTANF